MCDVCAEFLDLLQSYEGKVSKESDERPILRKDEVETVFVYIQSWSQRQCMCCFRDPKNFERFNLITQSILCLAVCQLKELREDLVKAKSLVKNERELSNESCSDSNKGSDNTLHVKGTVGDDKPEELKAIIATDCSESSKPVAETDEKYRNDLEKKSDQNECGSSDNYKSGIEKVNENQSVRINKDNGKGKEDEEEEEEEEEVWSMQEKEKLLHFLSKVFLLNFPLYVAYKHSVQSKLEEISPQEAGNLNVFCDLHDPEIPVYLLRNVCLFCKSGGVHAMTFCFDRQSPETLPVSIAHAIIAIVCNLKLWLNFRSIMQLFVPLRSKVLRYMCNLSDKDLRMPGIKTMADFMWSAVKDPLDSPLTFDKDGLDLAFKYFTSSTLTMRLAGISQINSHINMFNELCNNESIIEVENVGQNLANWLIENQIISHIFGPNLHVEVIKQSHIILSFLAMECKITNEHTDIIWQAAQLKHCSKQVHDLLPPLIKNLEAGPVLHLYGLLCKLEPKDHTEQVSCSV